MIGIPWGVGWGPRAWPPHRFRLLYLYIYTHIHIHIHICVCVGVLFFLFLGIRIDDFPIHTTLLWLLFASRSEVALVSHAVITIRMLVILSWPAAEMRLRYLACSGGQDP
jgi:hypothetical protein